MKHVIAVMLLTLLTGATAAIATERQAYGITTPHAEGLEADHESEESGSDESEEGIVELSDESIRMAGIRIEKLTSQELPKLIFAPGEVQLDQYRSAEVTPLIDAVVIARHVQLGDEVEAGQRLVTLASVEVAAAQGELTVAATEWRRVRDLGRATVSAKRYTEAQVAYEQAQLKLSAYGLDDKQIQAISSSERLHPLGQFDLNTPLAGTVLRDDFRIGQRIEPGRSMFLIADESRVWVEANLSPRQARNVEIGQEVRVAMDRHWDEGRVIQKHHLLDERTRTVPVRIEVEPGGEHHHTGEFVQVAIATEAKNSDPTLVVPESALTQDNEGNWTVFVEIKPAHFKQTPVRRGNAQAGQVAISGLAEGTPVVVEGAFFLAAELAKGGFDIHGH